MNKDSAPIVICYDGSPNSEGAIDAAAALFGSRHAVVLTVGPTLTFAEGVALTQAVVPGNAFEDLNTADARRRADAGASYARGLGLDAEARGVIASETWQGIVDVADELDAAVIVIGSRGLSGLRRRTLGSVSQDVASHARRPVLIVPPARAR